MQEINLTDETVESKITALERELWAARDIVISSMAQNTNLEYRLRVANQRIAHLEKVARHRKQILNSTTWKIGTLVMKIFWPIRKILSATRKDR